MKKTLLETIKENSNNSIYSFADEFNAIIESKAQGYDNEGNILDNLKGFLEDMQKGGCQSGIIGEFIYHADCKAFYIAHIDDLEEFKQELKENIGEIKNRQALPHYTFMCWLAFEEYCFNIYSNLFEN